MLFLPNCNDHGVVINPELNSGNFCDVADGVIERNVPQVNGNFWQVSERLSGCHHDVQRDRVWIILAGGVGKSLHNLRKLQFVEVQGLQDDAVQFLFEFHLLVRFLEDVDLPDQLYRVGLVANVMGFLGTVAPQGPGIPPVIVVAGEPGNPMAALGRRTAVLGVTARRGGVLLVAAKPPKAPGVSAVGGGASGVRAAWETPPAKAAGASGSGCLALSATAVPWTAPPYPPGALVAGTSVVIPFATAEAPNARTAIHTILFMTFPPFHFV